MLLTLTQGRSRELGSKVYAAVDIECISTYGVLDISIVIGIRLR
jgi:hypothetical protein